MPTETLRVPGLGPGDEHAVAIATGVVGVAVDRDELHDALGGRPANREVRARPDARDRRPAGQQGLPRLCRLVGRVHDGRERVDGATDARAWASRRVASDHHPLAKTPNTSTGGRALSR